MKKSIPKIITVGMIASSIFTYGAFAADTSYNHTCINQNTPTYDENIQPMYWWTDQYKCTVDNLNVRTGPGTEYDVITKLNKNDIVGVHDFKENAKGETWAKVDLGDWKDGWVLAGYLEYFAPHP